jgi:hypothetical protein
MCFSARRDERKEPGMSPKTLSTTTVLMLWIPLGCGGGDGGSYNSPTSPTQPADVSGTWMGSAVVSSATAVGNNTVPAAYLESRPLSLSIEQSGRTLLATMVADVLSPTCRFSGTVSGNAIALTFQDCVASGPVTSRHLIAASFSGSVSGTRISGDLQETFGTTVYEPEARVTTLASVNVTR